MEIGAIFNREQNLHGRYASLNANIINGAKRRWTPRKQQRCKIILEVESMVHHLVSIICPTTSSGKIAQDQDIRKKDKVKSAHVKVMQVNPSQLHMLRLHTTNCRCR
jgi:hypothetical protein